MTSIDLQAKEIKTQRNTYTHVARYIGGDKPAPFLNLPQEDNPYLGFRGSRLLLGRTDLLRAQARALARARVRGGIRRIS